MIRSNPARPVIGWLCACCVFFIWAGWVVVSRLGATRALMQRDNQD